MQRMRALPVGSHLDALAAVMSAPGYARYSIRDRLWTLAGLGRWLKRRGLSVMNLRPDIVAAPPLFLRRPTQRARVPHGAAATLRLFLEYLEQEAIISPAPSSSPTPIALLKAEGQARSSPARRPRAVARHWVPTLVCGRPVSAAPVRHGRHRPAGDDRRARQLVRHREGIDRLLASPGPDRVALDRPALDTREVYHPVLDCFMRVLPYAYRQVDAPLGTLISVRVDGPAADDWQLYRALEGWLLTGGLTITPDTVVTIPGDVAWRLFTKGIARAQRERRVAISGDSSLADGRHHPKSCSYREPASGCPRRCVARPNSAQVSEL